MPLRDDSLDPHMRVDYLDREAWRGPQCDGAVDVEVVCRRIDEYTEYDSCTSASVLRMPEDCSALSKAALRAYDSLDCEHSGVDFREAGYDSLDCELSGVDCREAGFLMDAVE